MTEKYILAIDEGTTSTRAIIFDHDGREVASAQKEFYQYFPEPGWVEHDANKIWMAVQTTIANAFINSGIWPNQIAAIGITNVKRPLFGTRIQVSQFIMQSFGSHGRQQN